jgi:uncharacterized oxidoreductase
MTPYQHHHTRSTTMKTIGNTILITGGGSGIGRGLAEAFHKLGNTVIVAGRRESVLSETARANPGMEFVTLDTANVESITKAAAEMKTRFPKLNVVINNAGMQSVLNFSKSGDDAFDDAALSAEVQTNIMGILRMTTAFLPQLQQQPSATLVNVSSGLAFVPMARFPVYCATKAFVHSFTMSLRSQMAGTSVSVIELAPPWVKTDLDAAHESPSAHEGMSPMPLDAFIEAAMQELSSDETELKVAGAKFLYGGGVSDKLYATFEQINH